MMGVSPSTVVEVPPFCICLSDFQLWVFMPLFRPTSDAVVGCLSPGGCEVFFLWLLENTFPQHC